MEISIYSTIDFSKARNLLTERQKSIKAFNPIVPEGGCISLLEINPKQYISIKWWFINEKTGKITTTTAESSDGMHYVAIPEKLRLGTYRLKIETRHLVGDTMINETTISNPFEYVKASSDVVTIVSRNADNNLVGNLLKNTTIIQPIYTNPPSGGDIPEVPSRTTAKLMKTGQTTSYRTGDDGDLEAGREVDFFTLAENNPFGNTNRFTDELGGQTYANNIVIDWSTYDGSTVLGYYRSSSAIYNGNWDNTILFALNFGVSSFGTGWRVPNIKEFENIYNYDLYQKLSYPPFGLFNIQSFTSTTSQRDTNSAFMATPSAAQTFIDYGKTYLRNAHLFCRDFTVNGTILT